MLFLFLVLFAPNVPDIPLVKLDQLEQRFERGVDTTYVVNFWATWCKPCVAELPAFDKLQRDVAGKPIKVLLVNLDDKRDSDKVQAFLMKRGFTAETMLLDENKPNQWIDRVSPEWSGAIPATLLVQGGTRRSAFFEQEFSYELLNSTLTSFIQESP